MDANACGDNYNGNNDSNDLTSLKGTPASIENDIPSSPSHMSKKAQKRLAKKHIKAQRVEEKRTARLECGESKRQRKRKNRNGEHLPPPQVIEDVNVYYQKCTQPYCHSFNETARLCQIRAVAPYIHSFESYVKKRWIGRSILSVFHAEFHSFPPNYYEQAISLGAILVNGDQVAPSYILQNGDHIVHTLHRHEPLVHIPCSSQHLMKELVVAETNDMLVLNKPSSMPVHPSGAYRYNSLLFLVQKEMPDIQSELFPVHRLDRLTSGLLLLGKSAAKARALTEEISSRRVQKHYLALVMGDFPICDELVSFHFPSDNTKVGKVEKDGEWYWHVNTLVDTVCHKTHRMGVVDTLKLKSNDVEDRSKVAETLFRKSHVKQFVVNNQKVTVSVVECVPKTGRTHQIRVHLQYLGFPIISDPLYGEKLVVADHSFLPTDNVLNLQRLTMTPELKSEIRKSEEQLALDQNYTNKICRQLCTECHAMHRSHQLGTTKDGNYEKDSSDLWMIPLHSYKYAGPEWNFSSPLPFWALKN